MRRPHSRSAVSAGIGVLTLFLMSGCGQKAAHPPGPAASAPVQTVPAPSPSPPATPTQAANSQTPSAPADQTASASGQDESQNPYNVLVGKPAPEFATTTTKGKPLSLEALRGKVVLLDYWATWCGPCKMAMPTLETLYKNYSSQGLKVVGISIDGVDGNDTVPYVPAVARQLGVTYTISASPKQNATAAQNYNVAGIPAQFLIDKKGVVRWTSNGFSFSEGQELSVLIQKLLTEPA